MQGCGEKAINEKTETDGSWLVQPATVRHSLLLREVLISMQIFAL